MEARSIEALGCDYTAGARRARGGKAPVQARRVAKATLRCKRLVPFANVCERGTIKATRQGTLPAALYGAAVNGVSDADIRRITRGAAVTLRPKARGRNQGVVLALAGIDTLAEASVAPMGQWASEVW